MKIAIVDDEEIWRLSVRNSVQKYVDSFDRIDLFHSGNAFLSRRENYDVVLMDIDMPGLDGFDTIVRYKEKHDTSIVLILTTHLDYARKGYLVDAFRYIDKANMEVELEEAFEKIREINKRNQFTLVGRDGQKVKTILIKDIYYIETSNRYCAIITEDAQYTCNVSMRDLENQLDEYGFFRCHKSFLVNLNAVKHLDHNFAYFPGDKKAYISVRKYVETKKRYIAIRKKYAAM
ncbi:MAG: LytTR family DNA-binding domain-containing protein [Lachnospiraceae bacterium]|nr:LytTR family DNA-binding domain-containing protein [Lachnospiraceae bacterium]